MKEPAVEKNYCPIRDGHCVGSCVFMDTYRDANLEELVPSGLCLLKSLVNMVNSKLFENEQA